VHHCKYYRSYDKCLCVYCFHTLTVTADYIRKFYTVDNSALNQLAYESEYTIHSLQTKNCTLKERHYLEVDFYSLDPLVMTKSAEFILLNPEYDYELQLELKSKDLSSFIIALEVARIKKENEMTRLYELRLEEIKDQKERICIRERQIERDELMAEIIQWLAWYDKSSLNIID